MRDKLVLLARFACLSYLSGCGSDLQDDGTAATESTGALRVVNGCGAKARACEAAAKTDADRQTCRDDLRACVQALGDHDGGASDPDGGAVTPPVMPPTTNPPAGGGTGNGNTTATDGGTKTPPNRGQRQAVHACVDGLLQCLHEPKSQPLDCVNKAADCLKNVH